MARIIEFIGVSGVGKSTTYKSLGSKYSKGANWKLHDQLWKEENSASELLKSNLKYYLKKVMKPGSLGNFQINEELVKRFIAANSQLSDLFWQSLGRRESYYGQDLRFYEVDYIRYVFQKIQRVKESQFSGFCILDEGLIHNLNYFTPQPSSPKEVLKILDLFDLPHAVVFFQADIKILMKRISKRKSLINRDLGLSQEELLQSRQTSIKEKQVFIEALKERNVPVLQLEAREGLKHKTNRIFSFLKELEKNPSFAPALQPGLIK